MRTGTPPPDPETVEIGLGAPPSPTASGAWTAGWRVALIYVAVGGTYIVLSDRIVGWVAGDSAARMQFLQTTKGAGFILITALMLLLLVARFTRRLEHARAREAALAERLRAAARIESLGLMTGNLAHDFRNNLTAILALAESLRIEPLGEEAREAIQDIALTAKRSADQVNILLGMTRRDEGPPFEEMDVAELVRGWHSLLRCVAGGQIDLRIAVHANGTRIVGSPALVFHAVLNLVINARDALDGRGTITLEARSAEHAGHPGVEIRVADNGPGVPPELRDRIFEIGFTTKRAGVGTGYGLPSVAHTAFLHGGFASLDPEHGPGACFRVWLPAAPALAEVA